MDAPINAKAALLQVLLAGPGYGLDLIDRVRERSGGALTLGQGSVYPALRSMEEAGWLKSRLGAAEVGDRGGRPRTYYMLTPRGRKVAEEQREAVRALFG